MHLNRLLCKLVETRTSLEISAGKESEIGGVNHILAMALPSSLTREMAPCCSHFIYVCKGNGVGVMPTSDLKFIFTENSSERYCFVVYVSALSCWPFHRVRNKNL